MKISKIKFILASLILIAPLSVSPAKATGFNGLTMYVKSQSYNYIYQPPVLEEFTSGVCWQGLISTIDFSWHSGGVGDCPTDFFTDFTTGYIKAPVNGTVYFYDVADDGFVLKIDDQIVINNWKVQPPLNPNGQGIFKMIKDRIYSIKVWHNENDVYAYNRLFWNYRANDFGTSEIIPNNYLATDPSVFGNSNNRQSTDGSCASSAQNASAKSNGNGSTQNANAFCVFTSGPSKTK